MKWHKPKPKLYVDDAATWAAYRLSYVRERETLANGHPITWYRDVIRDARGRIVWARLQRGVVRPSIYDTGTIYTRNALHRMRLRFYRAQLADTPAMVPSFPDGRLIPNPDKVTS